MDRFSVLRFNCASSLLLTCIAITSIKNKMNFVAGACQFQDGCDKSCCRFRKDPEDENLCVHCRHDISNHFIIGILQDGKFFLVGDNSAIYAATLPLLIQETPEEERKKIFKTKPRSSIGNKRKITTDADEPRRWSGARNPVPASKPTNVVVKLIAMKRDDEVPQTIFDHTELGADYFVNLELTIIIFQRYFL